MRWKPRVRVIARNFGLVILGLIAYGIWVEPNQLGVRHVWVRDPSLASVLRGKIAIQISDLHIRKLGRREQKVIKTLEELKPDLVFLTGDYIQWNGDHEAALDFLSKLKARIGIWAVMGDYDYSQSRSSCLFCHEPVSGKPTRRHGVKFLRNDLEPVQLEEGILWIGGIDMEAGNPFASDGGFPLELKEKPIILLSHNPLIFDLIDEDRDLLVLAGDTHGGQIPIPSWLWKILGYEKSARYGQGLFERGGKKMFVSRGVGTSHFPIRIFRGPELVVLHFTTEQTAHDRLMNTTR